MFVATPGNQVIALDATNGHGAVALSAAAARKTSSCCIRRRRGVALHGDKVFFAAGDAVLVALDARTGNEVWTTTVAENRTATTCRWRRSWRTAR